MSKDIRTRSSTPAGTDVHTKVLVLHLSRHTYVRHESLAFLNSTSAFHDTIRTRLTSRTGITIIAAETEKTCGPKL